MKKNSDYKFSSGKHGNSDVYQRRGKPGDTNELIKELSESTGVDENIIRLNIYFYIGSIEPYSKRKVMTLYYLYKKSIVDVRFETKMPMTRVELYLEDGKNQIIKKIQEEKTNGKI